MSDLERLDEALGWTDQAVALLRNEHPQATQMVGAIAVLQDLSIAYRDLLANGQRVEWCEEHDLPLAPGWSVCLSWMWTGRKADCRIVSKLLSVYPKEAEND